MNTMQLAQALVALCREGQEAFDALYAADAVSVEPGPQGREDRGIAALKAKSAWWYGEHEVHAFSCSGPWPHGDRFILRFEIDVTHRASGQRMQMEEMGLYTVRDGKIVREEFFYDTTGN
ncbi:MAG TPA: nuclear transport factor 2 family protein [Nevskiaceae bacterium]|nr:nuclear transport factor 2 family protein [Nevskiaceae bacterium]